MKLATDSCHRHLRLDLRASFRSMAVSDGQVVFCDRVQTRRCDLAPNRGSLPLRLDLGTFN